MKSRRLADYALGARSRRTRTRVACAGRPLRSLAGRRPLGRSAAARTVARGVRPVRALPPGFIPILRHLLALAPLPRAGLVLDLACGQGLKAPLLAEACGPQARLIGVDIDRAAIRAATADRRPPTANHRGLQPTDKRSSILDLRPSEQLPFIGVVADALALPLVDGCCAAAERRAYRPRSQRRKCVESRPECRRSAPPAVSDPVRSLVGHGSWSSRATEKRLATRNASAYGAWSSRYG